MLNVLLVHHDEIYVEMVRREFALQSGDVTVTLARGVAQAQSLARRYEYHIAIVAYLLPDGRVTDLLQQQAWQSLPVIVLAAAADRRELIVNAPLERCICISDSAETIAHLPRIVRRLRRATTTSRAFGAVRDAVSEGRSRPSRVACNGR